MINLKKLKKIRELKNMKDPKEAIGGKMVKVSSKVSTKVKNIVMLLKKTKNILQEKSVSLSNLSILLFSVNSEKSSKDWTALLTEFYNLWPLQQWISSLTGLILLYYITGHYYNKWLSDKGGWIDWKTRIWLIFSDFTINLMLGLYYMNHRETAIGVMMLKCPIAVSPLIFVIELVCFYMYYRFGKDRSTKKGG